MTYSIKYNDDKSNKDWAGFIAEETPDIVTPESKDGLSGLPITAILMKVTKIHQRDITKLTNIIDTQSKEILKLKQKVAI